jgi:L-seryl-tRNA(Ser) seleniumtransferase
MYVAVEHYLTYDHDKEWKDWEARVATIENAVKGISGITTEVKVPPLGNVTPTLHVMWDSNKVKLTTKELQEKLRTGNPSIEVVGAEDENHISMTTWVMKPGEDKIVATRLKEELTKASA